MHPTNPSSIKKFRLPRSIVAAVTCLSLWLLANGPESFGQEIPFKEALVLKRVGRSAREPVHQDAVEALIVAGKWAAPKAGDAITAADGNARTWEAAVADKDGWFNHAALNGGYAHVRIPAEAERVMILEASGHGMVYVNGEPRTGDPYQTGYVRLPVMLRKGDNGFLFHCPRGRFRARLVVTKEAAFIDLGDTTLPDLIVGKADSLWGAVVVINASPNPLEKATLSAHLGGSNFTSPIPPLPPLSTRKVGFRFPGKEAAGPPMAELELRLLRDGAGDRRPIETAKLALRIRRPEDGHKRTFLSQIDGSVQYYAVNPARPVHAKGPPSALFLSLHGAGVEATGHADSYFPKSWGHLVAPTNRRPFGFDWEDWGRLDALEVLDHAQNELRTDPRRTYLTGHSMGGHGVWHLGATFPDHFAAIGPSAGWVSFWSYVGSPEPPTDKPIPEIFRRAASASNTLNLVRNYSGLGIYVLHGDADDNVPVNQARTMKKELSAFHKDFAYHEQSGAGHWWDASDEPGTDCVDWAPMFDWFARRVVPARDAVRAVDFTTANPGVSAWCHWVGIDAQVKSLKPSTVRLRFDPGKRRFVGTTDNVARLALDLGHLIPGQAVSVELDGIKKENIPWPERASRIWFEKEKQNWLVVDAPKPSRKGPHRNGPFKDAFRNRIQFVYGTRGSAEENSWAYAKARYDAETFWYRGNASVDLIADHRFDAAADRDRGVILYGNADTNAAWKALLADSPVHVARGRLRTGDREETRPDLACLFLRPRPGSDRACVGVVTGTGVAGMRLTDRLPYFVSGVGFPDCTVIGPEMLVRGYEGVRAAGFFGPDWGVSTGEIAWQE